MPPDSNVESTLVWYKASDEENTRYWTNELDNFLLRKYSKKHQTNKKLILKFKQHTKKQKVHIWKTVLTAQIQTHHHLEKCVQYLLNLGHHVYHHKDLTTIKDIHAFSSN